VRRGIAAGWCKPVPSHDVEGRFRRRFAADLAMDCEEPITVEVWGRYDRRCKQTTAIFVDVTTRCRKCESCLRRKARFWTGRAMTEYLGANATWMVTLTLRPEMHYYFDARMQQPLYRGSRMVRDAVRPPEGGLASATGFRLRAREIGYEITDYLKRVRKYRGPFRYLLVAERHLANSASEAYGRPHFHLLVHEGAAALITANEWAAHAGPCEHGCTNVHGKPRYHVAGEVCDHALVRGQWPHGFTKVMRCMDVKSAVYVCKYVSKDPMARVRASIGYGGEKEAPPQTLDGEDRVFRNAISEEGKLTSRERRYLEALNVVD